MLDFFFLWDILILCSSLKDVQGFFPNGVGIRPDMTAVLPELETSFIFIIIL